MKDVWDISELYFISKILIMEKNYILSRTLKFRKLTYPPPHQNMIWLKPGSSSRNEALFCYYLSSPGTSKGSEFYTLNNISGYLQGISDLQLPWELAWEFPSYFFASSST